MISEISSIEPVPKFNSSGKEAVSVEILMYQLNKRRLSMSYPCVRAIEDPIRKCVVVDVEYELSCYENNNRFASLFRLWKKIGGE